MVRPSNATSSTDEAAGRIVRMTSALRPSDVVGWRPRNAKGSSLIPCATASSASSSCVRIAPGIREFYSSRPVQSGLSVGSYVSFHEACQRYRGQHRVISSYKYRLTSASGDPRCQKETIMVSNGMYARFITSEGTFTVRLFDKEAPKTVENFVGLTEGTKNWTDPRTNQQVRKPYYNGIIFHRVINGFMIQGGDPLGQGIGGPGYTFPDEFHPQLRHDKPGILSMANRGPNTNGGQFFITLGPTPHLDDRHSVFGEVVDGLDVIQAIGRTKTDARDKPVKDVV